MSASFWRRSLAVVLLMSAILAENGWAIPAFARRYRISCSVCHAPFPRLKEYGTEFAGNGFILKEAEKSRDYVTSGDDLLWLNRDFPVAVRFDAFAVAESDNPVSRDLQVPWGLKLLSGGTVYHNIGYYFYFYLSERGEIAGIEDAYIHFDDIFGMPLDVMVGQFQTSDPLLKRELRLTFEDYMIYKSHPSGSITDLTYDRGVMMVYSIGKTGTDVVAMMVNGNGKVEAGDDRKFDVDSHKNYGVRISQSLGGFFRIGGFYYRGSESQNGRDNTITYIGPDLSLSAGSLDLEMQYLERRDTDPLFTGATEADTKGMVAELTVSPQGDRSRVYITGLYNWIKSDLSDLDYQSATLSLSYLLARNLRLVGEYTRDLERKSNRLVLGTVTGF